MDAMEEVPVDDEADDAESQSAAKKSKSKKGSGGFEAMGLSHPVYKAIIRKGYRIPTPIQRKVISLVVSGRDVVAMARTGSGKTAAFLVPLIERLQEHSLQIGARGVVLSPTRELAEQTLKFTKELGAFTNLRSCLLIGGESLEDQFASLAANPDILIATPGRLMHHISQTTLTLSAVQLCVFDEADRLFEMGFADQIKEILNKMPEHRQICLFSATLPQILADFTSAGLHEPELVRLDTDTKISQDLRITFFTVRSEQKNGALITVINEFIDADEQTVVFAATKHHVEFITQLLRRAGHSVCMIYGDLDPAARKINVAKFRAKKAQFLVVTDIAARGIDIPMLDNVINYDFPMTPKLFVHRVGRAARAGRSGKAISFVAMDEMPYMLDVHLFLGRKPINCPEHRIDRNDPTSVVFGSLPGDLVEADCATVVQWVERDPWLQSQAKTIKNAYKAYNRSRSKASPQSVRRYKELGPVAMHPWLQQELGAAAIERTEMVQALKGFRPHVEVFRMSTKSGTGRSGTIKHHKAKKSAAKQETVDYFDPKAIKAPHYDDAHCDAAPVQAKLADSSSRGGSTGRVSKRRAKRQASGQSKDAAALPTGSSGKTDSGFFIDYRPPDAFSEESLRVRDNSDSGRLDNRNAIEEAVLNLTGDDNSIQKRSQVRWDKKKGKYVETNSMNDNKYMKLGKNEAGVLIKGGAKGGANKPTHYETWVEKTNQRIPQAGTTEGANTLEEQVNRTANFVVGGKEVGKKRGRGGRMYGGGAGDTKPKPAGGAKSELRPVQQIAKERKRKEGIKQRLKSVRSKKAKRK